MIRVGDQEFPWMEGLTVTSLLAALEDTYEYAAVRIDQRVVSRPHFDRTPVPDNCQVYLLPLIAGG